MGERILVTGGSGQIGTELIPALADAYGEDNLIMLDIQEPEEIIGTFKELDCQDKDAFRAIVEEYKVTQIFHLASILSAAGEKVPYKTWEVNIETLRHVLEFALDYNIRVFWPSSIAAFGPTTPKDNTPQETVMSPTTMYGITKRAGELLCNYYHHKFGIDVRSLRYPGLISYKQEPGGGTTDYAVAIFYDALAKGTYECFVSEDTVLPMMYMDDAIEATRTLMDAPAENLSVHTSYNLAAISFSVGELATEVKKHVPKLSVSYKPDTRQTIADSWPRSIDDSVARSDWGWQHEFDLARMSEVMIGELKKKLSMHHE